MPDEMSAGQAASNASGQLEASFAGLLDWLVGMGQTVFQAEAASITRFDAEAHELVFEAVAGAGAEATVGLRFPADQGIAGFVLAAQQSLAINDVGEDERFARDVAARTGYVPTRLAGAPLLYGEDALGVIQVLDWPKDRSFGSHELDLLAQLANGAAGALHGLQQTRGQCLAPAGKIDEPTVIERLAVTLGQLERSDQKRGLELLEAVERFMDTRQSGPS